MNQKQCPRCGDVKPFDSFQQNKSRSDGLSVYCRTCNQAYRAEWINTPRAKEIATRSRLRREYGISLEEMRSLVIKQENRCAICGRLFNGVDPDVPCVDHDHQTSAVRGLLCRPCNLGLGHFKDSAVLMRLGAVYLERSEKKPEITPI
jgi:hypothetical protein